MAATPQSASAVEVIPVASESDWAAFFAVPEQIYHNDPHYVPPLRAEVERQLSPQSSFLTYGQFEAFLAHQDGQPVGRVVASINHRLNQGQDQKLGLFGYFECIDDKAVSGALFEAACRWLKEQGCSLVRGPVDLSTHIHCLCLVQGFDDPPTLRMPYNPSYYPGLIEAAGWAKAKDAIAYHYPMVLSHEAAFQRAHRHACAMGVTFRPIRLKGAGFEVDCRSLHRVYSESFSDNWMSTPRTEAEFLEDAKGLRSIVDPKLFPIAEHDGRMIGFWMCLPDYNIPLRHVGGRLNAIGILKMLWYRRQIHRARVFALGVLPDYQRKRWAVAPALIYLGVQGGNARSRPFASAELSWVWEDNQKSRSIIESSGGVPSKTYRLYERSLD
ncbi:MAG: hypothetical protein ACPGOY_13285 [Rhodospirillaceae bacterium]